MRIFYKDSAQTLETSIIIRVNIRWETFEVYETIYISQQCPTYLVAKVQFKKILFVEDLNETKTSGKNFQVNRP